MSSLSQEQREALDQLWSITASETPSQKERDERILRECGWQVQSAVEVIFAMPEQREGSSSRSSVPSPPADPFSEKPRRSSRSRPTGNGARTPGHVGLGGSPFGVLLWPFRLLMGVVTGAWYFIIRTFIPLSLLPRLPRFLLPPSLPPNHTPAKQDPTLTALSFIRDLELLTSCSSGTGTLPEFYVGPYREFLTQVRKEGKIGMVVLVCGEHEDDEEFKRDVLCDAELVRMIKEKDLMVWGADVRSREGYQVSQTLLNTTFPSITFVSLLPSSANSNSTSSSKLSVLNSIAGPPSTTTSASSIIQTLTTSVLPRATPYLARLRRERLTLEEARHLREEQDRAFREAEKKDRERMAADKAAKELERIKAERAKFEAQEIAMRIENRRVWRRYARKHLLPPSEGPIRVALRTPLNAERNIRNFNPGPSTLPLFIYAETLLIPRDQVPEDDPDSPPLGYEPEWDFRIVTTYPRRDVERKTQGGEEVWEIVKKAGGALVAEKEEGGVWADAELKAMNGEESDEEVIE